MIFNFKRFTPENIVIENIEPCCENWQALDNFDPANYPILLESTSKDNRFGRHTIMSTKPICILTLRGFELFVTFENETIKLADTPEVFWKILAEAFDAITLKSTEYDSLDYTPGWAGFIGYEVARLTEILPKSCARDTAMPDMQLALYDSIAITDTQSNQTKIITLKFPNKSIEESQSRANLFEALLVSKNPDLEKQAISHEIAAKKNAPNLKKLKSNFSPSDYKNSIQHAIEYIKAGDIFQVNMTQRFEFENPPAPLLAYRALSKINPAWYAAFLEFSSSEFLSNPKSKKSCAIISCSPELFISCKQDQISTRPIKGTRPRFEDKIKDNISREELLASSKDNAELAMIIDLLRNDLGKVCTPGSVQVKHPCNLESHPTVFHLVGTVEGKLNPSTNHAEVLRATFPGGSITGAPKIRAMEIIDELERNTRSVYTGIIGMFCANRNAQWNIAIRTIFYDDNKAFASAGGGIVADSVPQNEYEETLHKANAMIRVLQNLEN